MADTAALSPQYLKQLRAEREARLAAKKGDDAVIEIESNSDSDEVQLIASPPKRKRADDGSDDEVQFLPSPPKRPAKADDDEIEVLDRPPRSSSHPRRELLAIRPAIEADQRDRVPEDRLERSPHPVAPRRSRRSGLEHVESPRAPDAAH